MQVHFRPLLRDRTGRRANGDFDWRTSDGGVEGTGHRHVIDLLWGSDRLRRAVDAGEDPLPLCDPPAPPGRWAGDAVLLYS
ncbi:hypothetical protein [Streptomyces mirabilis]|uniref:hypothetical protein n=1 Tax=Streptomyces mirabilis TaxID=68239 RepID=UPI003692EB6F